LLGGFRILRVAGVQVARLQAADGLQVFQTLHAPAQLIDLRHGPLLA
jgi:hypothetical protein